MKSIMQEKDGRCYLCMKLDGDHSIKPIQEHHAIYGWANRRLSEKWGLKLYLCVEKHHEYGKMAVHQNKDIRQMICAEAQECFERHYPNESFLQIFGKNWKEEHKPNTEKPKEEKGFWFVDTEV